MPAVVFGKCVRNLAFGKHFSLPLIFSERWEFHLGFAGVRAMDGLAIVAERLLREAFGITGGLRPFRPGISVTVQRDALDFEADTSLMKFSFGE